MFLLRSRLRAGNSSNSKKQALMAENTIHNNTEQNQSPNFTSFLNSPRFFGGFLSRTVSDDISVPTPSPTSILANHHHQHHPFGYDKTVFKPSSPITTSPSYHEQKQGIGLALLQDDKNREFSDYDPTFSNKNNKKMVLFAAKLKVEVPSFHTSDVTPKSPGDFGIKTKNPPLLLRSLSINSPASKRGRSCSSSSSDHHQDNHQEAAGAGGVVTLSVTEMEMSEEYTCVITHGPNPKITHIFDDTVIVESPSSAAAKTGNLLLLGDQQKDNVDAMTSLPVDFLGFCYACNNKLDDQKDIYMFRGEKAFCSEECRFEEMNSDSYQF